MTQSCSRTEMGMRLKELRRRLNTAIDTQMRLLHEGGLGVDARMNQSIPHSFRCMQEMQNAENVFGHHKWGRCKTTVRLSEGRIKKLLEKIEGILNDG